MSQTYLEHHGVLGMKWGVRRYQPYSLIPRKSGKSGKMVGDARKSKAKVNKGKSVSSKKKKGAKSNNRKADYKPEIQVKKLSAKEKERIINSGDIKEISKYNNQFSNNELRNAMDRATLNKRLNEMNADTKKSGMQKAEDVMRTVSKVNDMAQKGINTYNTFAKVYNSLSEESIPVLDGKYRKKMSAETKRLVKEGTAQEIWENRDKFTQEQRDQINKRYSFEKATRAQMKNESSWRSDDHSDAIEKYKSKRTTSLGDSPFTSKVGDDFWDKTATGSRTEREAHEWESRTNAGKKQTPLLLTYDENLYKENIRTRNALEKSAARVSESESEKKKKKK